MNEWTYNRTSGVPEHKQGFVKKQVYYCLWTLNDVSLIECVDLKERKDYIVFLAGERKILNFHLAFKVYMYSIIRRYMQVDLICIQSCIARGIFLLFLFV